MSQLLRAGWEGRPLARDIENWGVDTTIDAYNDAEIVGFARTGVERPSDNGSGVLSGLSPHMF